MPDRNRLRAGKCRCYGRLQANGGKGDRYRGWLAEPKGFEPSRRFPVCTLSRGVPSTTRPRLRRPVYWAAARGTREISMPEPIQGKSPRDPVTCHWSFIQPRPEPVADLRLSAWDEQSPGARNPHRVQRVGRLRLSGAGRSLRGSGSRGPSGALRCCSR